MVSLEKENGIVSLHMLWEIYENDLTSSSVYSLKQVIPNEYGC